MKRAKQRERAARLSLQNTETVFEVLETEGGSGDCETTPGIFETQFVCLGTKVLSHVNKIGA